MDGVVILSTSQVVNDIWSIIGGFITAGLIILGTILFSSLHNNDHIFAAAFIALMIIGCIIFTFRYIPRYTQYKVTLTDDASWYRFTQAYEVIDVQGSILTVKERQ